MKTYIQTGSTIQLKGYRWWEIIDTNKELKSHEPDIWVSATQESRQWLIDGGFSMLLEQQFPTKRLSLLVTLPGDNSSIPIWRRRDSSSAKRGLKYDFVWISDNENEDKTLCNLAGTFLEISEFDQKEWQYVEWLKKIDECVEEAPDEAAGFSVNKDVLDNIVAELAKKPMIATASSFLKTDKTYILPDNSIHRLQVAAFLKEQCKNLKNLPGDEIIVLVTGQDKKRLEAEQTQHWCVMSSAVDQDYVSDKKNKKNKKKLRSNDISRFISDTKKNFIGSMTLFLVWLLGVLIGIKICQWSPHQPLSPFFRQLNQWLQSCS